MTFAATVAFGQKESIPLTNVIDNQPVVLNNFTKAKAVVVIFSSNVCAYDAYYTERLRSLFATYASAVQFLLVNANQEADESPEKMKLKAESWLLGVPYLADKDQKWMKEFGARKTPEVFVLDPGSNFAVVYAGAIDDNPQLANGVKETYLKTAIDWVISGERVTNPNTRAVGCTMRSK